MGIHDGHRQRLKSRFLSQGLESFEDHNILELLLFYSIPRSDTNEIAHYLLKEFKTLSGVFDAPVEELCKIKGVSLHTATLIKLIPEMMAVYHTDKTKDTKIACTLEELGATATFLASDGAASITGQVIYVDGGYEIVGM